MSNLQDDIVSQSIERMDDDLAIHVVLAKLSDSKTHFAKIFSVSAQLMYERSMEKVDDLSEYEKKVIETTTYAFSQNFQAVDAVEIN